MTTASFRVVLAAAVAAVTTVGSGAATQAPAPADQPPSAKPAAATATPADAAPPERPAYSYQPEGRRDPFVSLLVRGSDPASAANRPSGVPGLLINEVTVKGIVRDRSGFIAIIQGPDSNKTYIVRSGEHLMDGAVKSISVDTVVFAQDVNDPLSLVKQREVRKAVRPLEDQRGVRE
jgi:type IV pilus assembly protein PilP